MKLVLIRRISGVALAAVLIPLAAEARQQTTVIDSIAVAGAERSGRTFVTSRVGIPLGAPISYRDVQRAVEALFATGQFDSVDVFQATVDGKEVLLFRVAERPVLTRWTVTGTEALTDRAVRSRVKLTTGTAYNPAAAIASISAIDSLYTREGYYQTQVSVDQRRQPDGGTVVSFAVREGPRVAISEVIIEGNEALSDDEIVGAMSSQPEGFFWFKGGEYSDGGIEQDTRQRLPDFYATRGYIDFQVLSDTLVIADGTGKATLILRVDEGAAYDVGTFETVGNRQYTDDQLYTFYPFDPERDQGGGFLGLGGGGADRRFDKSAWDAALGEVQNLYFNSGYLYAQVNQQMFRRSLPDGSHRVDLRWQIVEGEPAIINRIRILGNTITHESVVRAAILMVPGDIFRQDAMVQSYQRVSNLGFFEQPMTIPRIETINQQGDVDVIFEVEERRTGNINFGASLGQGTGVGGFIGLEEPNLFGKGKRVSFNWQFGSNINDFDVTYNDPSLRGGLISGTLNLHRTRQRFTVADLGRITTQGGSVQFGFPLFGSRFTRIFTSYTLEASDYDTPSLISRFSCSNCLLSSVGVSVQRETRIGLPFAIGGTLHRFDVSQTGGPLGGSGNFQRATFEGRWYAPLSQTGIDQGGVQFVFGYTLKTGFLWGDPGPHFRQLFSMGGTQFGIPLRGYEEFSITPQGFDPRAAGLQVNSVDAFGQAYLAMTGEIGMRLSQMLYLNTFLDAGNVWAGPEEYNPTRLFRGAGVGLSLLSPLGPIGLDYAYGFDRVDLDGNPNPGWKFHFKIGNFF